MNNFLKWFVLVILFVGIGVGAYFLTPVVKEAIENNKPQEEQNVNQNESVSDNDLIDTEFADSLIA